MGRVSENQQVPRHVKSGEALPLGVTAVDGSLRPVLEQGNDHGIRVA